MVGWWLESVSLRRASGVAVFRSFPGEVFPQTRWDLPGPVRRPGSHGTERSHVPAHVNMAKAANPGTAQVIKTHRERREAFQWKSVSLLGTPCGPRYNN